VARATEQSVSALPFKITAIDHVQITVPPELERDAKHFYRELLGLREIDKPAELKARGGAWYQLGNAQLHLAIDPGACGIGSRRHLCLAIDDLDAARAAMIGAGLEVIDEPIQADGLARFFLRDPAGNRVEIGKRR
jgi:catechol 2,3-dioxygenase-like lactoylglutathione lyase family enzyme